MNLIENFLNTHLIHAIGWTLIHSIWQIILIGLTLKLLLHLYKNHSPNLKYNLSISAYLLILIVSVTTFASYYNSGNFIDSSKIYSFPIEYNEVPINQPDQPDFSHAAKQSLISTIGNFISSSIQYIVGLWLAGLIIFYFRLAGSYWYIQRLKSRNLFPLKSEWNSRLKDLKHKIHIHKIIRIAESTAVQIPMVIGHLKPIILLPIGILSSLPVNQIEAIILHELAHIKRNDYLINLVKSFVEVIFFYHPVAWWISSIIDAEREHCCDDLAIQVCNENSSLRNALLNLHETNQKPTYIAAALFKNNRQLLKRIKRMKTQNLTKQNKFNGFAGTLILLISVAILTTFSAFSPTPSDLPVAYQNIGITNGELLSTIEEPANNDNTTIQADIPQPVILLLPDSTAKTKKKVDQDTDMDTDMDADSDEDKALQKELEEAEQKLKIAEKEIDKAMKAYNQAMIDYHKKLSKTNNLDDIESWSIAEGDYAKALALAELQLEQIDIAIPDFEEMRLAEILEEQLEVLEELSIDEHIDMSHDLLEKSLKLDELEEKLQSAEMIEHLELIEDQLEIPLEELEEVLAHQIEEIGNVQELEFEAQLLETKIKSELIKDRLIENKKDDLSFILSAKKLEVNGKVCSKELHQKYLELYEDITDEKLEGTTKLIFQD